MKNYKLAHYYLLQHYELNEILFTEAQTQKTAEMEAKYQNEKKQKEITMLHKDNEIKALNISRGKWRFTMLVVSSIVVFITLFIFFQWYKLRQKAGFSAELLRQQELRLKAIVETQEAERKRIAKDLHDGIGQLLTSLKHSWRNVSDEISEKNRQIHEKLAGISGILDETAIEVRAISHQMMPRALGEVGLIPVMEDLLHKAFLHNKHVKYEFEYSGIKDAGHFPENIQIAMYRVLQELINNILKHAEASEVNVQLLQSQQNLTLIVEDNGKGFNFNEQQLNGMGIANMITRVKSVNGHINYEPGPVCGMVVTIRIPLV